MGYLNIVIDTNLSGRRYDILWSRTSRITHTFINSSNTFFFCGVIKTSESEEIRSLLLQLAEKLQIPTEGKDEKTLLLEVIKKAKEKNIIDLETLSRLEKELKK